MRKGDAGWLGINKKSAVLTFVAALFALAGVVFTSDMAQVKIKFGEECEISETCRDMMYVDCGAVEDGPAYYINDSLEVIGTSGGFCMTSCSGSPKEWTECVASRGH